MNKNSKETPPGFRRRIVKDDDTGKVKRVTFAPNEQTRAIHKDFMREFDWVCFPEIYESIAPHLRNTFFVKVDIRDAFGSLNVTTTKNALQSVVTWKGTERFFFHKEGGIIQGANASPLIFELFCNITIDQELAEYCDKRGVTYTRYVDDLIFSSHKLIPKSMRKVFRKILRKHGFEPNPEKDKVVSIWKNKLKILGTMVSRDTVEVTTAFQNQYLDYLTLLMDGDKSLLNVVKGMRAWKVYVDRLNKLQRAL